MLKQHFSRYSRLLAVALLLIAIVLQMLPQEKAQAVFLPRSLLLTTDTDHGSDPGGTVGHTYDFTLNTDALGGGLGSPVSTRSIKFQYCTTPVYTQTCTTPTGLTTTGATLQSFTPGGSGFTIFTPPSNGTIVLTRGAAANINDDTAITAEFEDIVNPSNINETFFVRISFHTTADGSGAAGDQSSVAASTADPIVLNGIMPESLVFCTGFAVVTNCTSTTSQIANFDDLFSPAVTRWTKAEMAASTNAGDGYAITLFGDTLESGSNSIAAMGATNTASVPGTAQFGTNLVQNSSAGSFTSGIALTFSGPGTVTNGAGSPNVTGTGTTFLSLISVGDTLNITSGGTPESCVVLTVTSNTALVCNANITNAHTAGNYTVTQASGTNFGANVNPAPNSPTTAPLWRGQPQAEYDTADQFAFDPAGGALVAASNEGGTDSPTDGQKYTMSYIANVPGSQAAGLYSTTLTYICTATF